MPPRFAYWTILAGGLPTSFRAAEKDELLPTFHRLKEKHPDAEMKYFARGKLWASAEEARSANRPDAGPRGGAPPGERERRGRDWRPGGDHRDPRQRFKDAKKARNQDRRQERWDRKTAAPKPRPHGDPLAPRPDRRTGVDGSRQGRGDNRFGKPQGRPFGGAQDRPFDKPRGSSLGKPQGSPFGTARGRPFDKPRGSSSGKPQGRPFGTAQGRPFDKPRGSSLGKPQGRPFGGAQDRPFDKAQGRPPRERPQGDRFREDGRNREFMPAGGRRFERNQQRPPRPPGPGRPPAPGREPEPEPPPRPSEPAIKPPGPPERGTKPKAGARPIKRKRQE